MTDDSWITSALALNPSTPDDVLLALAATGDEAVQRDLTWRRWHPWPVEAAELLARSPHWEVRRELTQCAHVPDSALVTLARDPIRSVRLHLVLRPTEVDSRLSRYLPDEAYAILVRDTDRGILRELAWSTDVPPDYQRELARRHPNDDVIQLACGEEEVAAAAYRRMLLATNTNLRAEAFSSRRFRPPTDLAAALLADDETRLAALACAPLSPSAARSYVGSTDPAVRCAVAANPDLPLDLLTRLAVDPDEGVRKALLTTHACIPPDVLEQIDFDEHPRSSGQVAWLLAVRPDTATLTRYAASRHRIYRRTIACMPDLEQPLIELLAGDEDYSVRLLLGEQHGDRVPVELLVEMLQTWDSYTLWDFARNPRVPDDAIEQLIRSTNPRDRRVAHMTGRLSEEQRARLAAEPDPELAAANPPTRAERVKRLVEELDDPCERTRSTAARHRHLPVDVIRRLADRVLAQCPR